MDQNSDSYKSPYAVEEHGYFIATYVLGSALVLITLMIFLYVCCSKKYRLTWFEKNLLETRNTDIFIAETCVGRGSSVGSTDITDLVLTPSECLSSVTSVPNVSNSCIESSAEGRKNTDEDLNYREYLVRSFEIPPHFSESATDRCSQALFKTKAAVSRAELQSPPKFPRQPQVRGGSGLRTLHQSAGAKESRPKRAEAGFHSGDNRATPPGDTAGCKEQLISTRGAGQQALPLAASFPSHRREYGHKCRNGVDPPTINHSFYSHATVREANVPPFLNAGLSEYSPRNINSSRRHGTSSSSCHSSPWQPVASHVQEGSTESTKLLEAPSHLPRLFLQQTYYGATPNLRDGISTHTPPVCTKPKVHPSSPRRKNSILVAFSNLSATVSSMGSLSSTPAGPGGRGGGGGVNEGADTLPTSRKISGTPRGSLTPEQFWVPPAVLQKKRAQSLIPSLLNRGDSDDSEYCLYIVKSKIVSFEKFPIIPFLGQLFLGDNQYKFH